MENCKVGIADFEAQFGHEELIFVKAGPQKLK